MLDRLVSFVPYPVLLFDTASACPVDPSTALALGDLGRAVLVAGFLLVLAALSTAIAAPMLAARHGADRRLVATRLTQPSLVGLLTLPLWTRVAQGLVRHGA